MIKNEAYKDGLIYFDDENVTETDFENFKSYIDKQQSFFIENEITWAKGTVLKGEGTSYADYEEGGMTSVKSCKKIHAMYFTKEQLKDNTSIIESFELAPDECADGLTERINNGNYLYMADLKNFVILPEEQPVRKETKITEVKKIAPLKKTILKKSTTTVKSLKEVKKKIVSPSELYKLLRKKR